MTEAICELCDEWTNDPRYVSKLDSDGDVTTIIVCPECEEAIYEEQKEGGEERRSM